MDLVPHQIFRLLQLGHTDRAARSRAVWQCVSCQTCSTRCPQKVDCAGVMDAMRQQSAREGAVAPSAERVLLFQQAFLHNIRRHGRLNELELIGLFKARDLAARADLAFLFKEAGLAPRLREKKKFHLTGETVADTGVVKRIFDRCGA
jgi:heterodisulfide reductase subunit C